MINNYYCCPNNHHNCHHCCINGGGCHCMKSCNEELRYKLNYIKHDYNLHSICTFTHNGIEYIVVTGNNGIINYSIDKMKTWTKITNLADGTDITGSITCCIYNSNDNIIAAVATNGYIYYCEMNKDIIKWYRTDSWKAPAGITADSKDKGLYSIIYDKTKKRYVIVGQNVIITTSTLVYDSTKGHIQKLTDPYNEKLVQRFVYHCTDTGYYISAGHDGSIWYAKDSDATAKIEWTNITASINGTSIYIQGLCYDPNTKNYVFVGNDGVIFYTNSLEKNTQWKQSITGFERPKDASVRYALQSIIYDPINHLLVATGYQGLILITTDLTKGWTSFFGLTSTHASNKYFQFAMYSDQYGVMLAGNEYIAYGTELYPVIVPEVNTMIKKMFPIGYVMLTVQPENPYNRFGFGDWNIMKTIETVNTSTDPNAPKEYIYAYERMK